MKISEIFYSIQGEGMLAGVPSVFIRTSGCNLRCTWCDTPYTSWNPEGEERTIAAILAEVSRHRAAHAVVTGGEPMIAPEIAELTRALTASGLHVTIETAGTVYEPAGTGPARRLMGSRGSLPTDGPGSVVPASCLGVACDLMSISPKLANSTPHERDGGRWAAQHDRLRYQPEILKRLMSEYAYQLKFVVTAPEDLGEIETILEETRAGRSRVVLMPEGTDAETLSARARWLVEICKREGFRYGPRLHIDLYGNRRGV